MKILVVDDDPDMLAVTGFALQQAGYLVVRANSFGTALATFRQEQPDGAILDINLPGGSGFELCAAFRKESDLPILMLTVRGDEADLVRAGDLAALLPDIYSRSIRKTPAPIVKTIAPTQIVILRILPQILRCSVNPEFCIPAIVFLCERMLKVFDRAIILLKAVARQANIEHRLRTHARGFIAQKGFQSTYSPCIIAFEESAAYNAVDAPTR